MSKRKCDSGAYPTARFTSDAWRVAIGLAAGCIVGAAMIAPGAANPTLTTLYRFQGQPHNDGAEPVATLIKDPSGVFYGTTGFGGNMAFCNNSFSDVSGCGTVYKLVPPRHGGTAWHETVLYSFQGGSDGFQPAGPLVRDSMGGLYGTTSIGGGGGSGFCGSDFCGTVYKLTPPAIVNGGWTETVLYSFQGAGDGANPVGGVVFGPTGGLYGTTEFGGVGAQCSDCGTVYEILSVNGGPTESVLHAFSGQQDGADPVSTLLVDKTGALFGTAEAGGQYDEGTLFKLTRVNGNWQVGAAYHFPGYLWSGAPLLGALLRLKSGALVGTTASGGDPSCGYCGTVFMLTPPSATVDHWIYQVLHRFHGTDGAFPENGLAIDAEGNLYGTAEFGGSRGNCEFLPRTAKHPHKASPASSPGNSGCGTIFKLTPPRNMRGPWATTVLFNFSGGIDGGQPIGGLASDGKSGLIGTTATGGLGCPQIDGCGTIYMVKP